MDCAENTVWKTRRVYRPTNVESWQSYRTNTALLKALMKDRLFTSLKDSLDLIELVMEMEEELAKMPETPYQRRKGHGEL